MMPSVNSALLTPNPAQERLPAQESALVVTLQQSLEANDDPLHCCRPLKPSDAVVPPVEGDIRCSSNI